MVNNKLESNTTYLDSIRKSSDNKLLKQVTWIVMEPDTFDLHGHRTSEEEVRKACFSFNKTAWKASLYHQEDTEDFYFLENYLLPIGGQIGEQDVKKGSWLATVQFVSDSLWEDYLSGKVQGLSISARGYLDEIND
jgi:hypothetical protein